MKQYIDLVRQIRDTGNYKGDRTGTGTTSIFGHQMRFDLADGFPLVTAKRTYLSAIIHELLWFLKGETNIRYLKENGVRIWDEWVLPGTAEYRQLTKAEIEKAVVVRYKATDFTPVFNPEMNHPSSYEITRNEADENWIMFEYGSDESWENLYIDTFKKEPKVLIAGELGPVYGSQWRSWPNVQLVKNDDVKTRIAKGGDDLGPIDSDIDGEGFCQYSVVRQTIDQIANLIEMIKKNPDSRRLIVSAWNPAEVDNMALPPCHTMFQFYSNFMSYDELIDVIDKAGMKPDYMVSTRGQDLELDDEYYDHALMFCQEHDLPRRKLSCQLYQRKHHCALVA